MIPESYSRNIAQRCQRVMRELLPVVRNGEADDELEFTKRLF